MRPADAERVCVVYSPTDILKLIERMSDDIVSKSTLNGYVVVDGILGEIKNSNYPYCYGVPLRDTIGSVINLDIPKSLALQNKAYQNKEVRIYGHLKASTWQGTVKFAINTTKIEPKIEISEDLREQERLLSEFLRTHKRETKLFPNKETYRVCVIHSQSSQVKPDFERQMSDLITSGLVEIAFIAVNILAIEDIIRAVNEAEGDIIAIVRGGGSEGEFEVFNDFKLLETWNSKDTYKISALGHTRHRTYLDVFSDYSADTPTDAGAYIKKNIELLLDLREYNNLSEKHKKDMMKAADDWTKKLDEIQKQKDSEIKQLNDKLVLAQKEIRDVIEKTNKQVHELIEKNERKEQELSRRLRTYQVIAAVSIVLLLIVIIMIISR